MAAIGQDGAQAVTYRRVVAIALPVVLSNATVPLQGAVDTAMIGNLGSEVYLAGVTLGASAISILLAVFNFLQFGAGSLSAQALGTGDHRRVINVLARALILAWAIAAVLIIGQWGFIRATQAVFEGSAEAEALAATYLSIRIWAAPAELGVFALAGWFSGQELTRRLFEIQIVTSVLNIALNVLFVLGFGMDVAGVALGTLIASWCGFFFALWRAHQRGLALLPDWRPDRARLLHGAELGQMLRLNRDIFVRSILVVSSFAWMTRQGSELGDVVLAAHGVLYQLFAIATYGLDGFAIAAESLVGQAKGRRDTTMLHRAVKISTLAAFGLSLGMTGALFLFQDPLVALFTNVEAVRAVSHQHYVWAAMIPVVGVAAYHLDGIFAGAGEGAAMRNAMIISAGLYFAISLWLANAFAYHGVWASIWVLLALRALTLAVQYPALARRTGT